MGTMVCMNVEELEQFIASLPQDKIVSPIDFPPAREMVQNAMLHNPALSWDEAILAVYESIRSLGPTQ